MSVFCETCGQRKPKHITEAEQRKRHDEENRRLVESVVMARKHLDGTVEVLTTGKVYPDEDTFLRSPEVQGRFVGWS